MWPLQAARSARAAVIVLTAVAVWFSPSPASADETRTTAVDLGSAELGGRDISAPGEVDWYRFAVPRSTKLAVKLLLPDRCGGRLSPYDFLPDDSLAPTATLVDSNGAPFWSDSPSGSALFDGLLREVSLEGPRVYFLRVTGGMQCRYEIGLSPAAGVIDPASAQDTTPPVSFANAGVLRDAAPSDVSCPSTRLCVGLFGGRVRVLRDLSPVYGNGVSGWPASRWSEPFRTPAASAVDCPTESRCVSVDFGTGRRGGGSAQSSSPGSAGSWRPIPWPKTADVFSAPYDVSCPTVRFCVAVGRLFPAASRRALNIGSPNVRWRADRVASPIGSVLFSRVECPSSRICFGWGGESRARFGVMREPSRPSSRWQLRRVSRVPGPVTDLACVSDKRCVAFGPGPGMSPYGFMWTTVNAARSWTIRPMGRTQVSAVECPARDFCVAVGASRRKAGIWITRQPFTRFSSWRSPPRPEGAGVSQLECASPKACVGFGRSSFLLMVGR